MRHREGYVTLIITDKLAKGLGLALADLLLETGKPQPSLCSPAPSGHRTKTAAETDPVYLHPWATRKYVLIEEC